MQPNEPSNLRPQMVLRAGRSLWTWMALNSARQFSRVLPLAPTETLLRPQLRWAWSTEKRDLPAHG
jgi:hypothetical protein